MTMGNPEHVVLVTGASRGIGAATARAFAGLPRTALALVSRDRSALDASAVDCRAAGAAADVFVCDLTDETEVRRMALAVTERFGLPTVVVNNAGLFAPGGVADTDPAAFREQVDANLFTAFVVTHSLLPAMLERGSGHFLFMGSVASIRGYARGAAYCAAKHGLLGLARALREETRDRGLRVTTLLAGATWTDSWVGADLPEERFMPAEDIAAAARDAVLMSDRTVVEEILIRPQLGDV